MGIRNHVKVGTDMQEFDIVAEQRDAAGAPVVPGIAVFEGIDTAQPEPPGVVAGQAHRGANNGFIEKLQTVVLTGATGRIDADFTRFQAIQPEPDADGSQGKKQQFAQIHRPSIRNVEILHRNSSEITG